MRRISLLIYITISIVCSTSIYAFDGERKGFILGGGFRSWLSLEYNFPGFLVRYR